MNLSELREYVRDQTQTVEDELPNATIDRYLQEAFDRTIALNNAWPFFQKTWQITQAEGATTMTLPSDANYSELIGLYNPNGWRTEFMTHSEAREIYGALTVTRVGYSRFSVWDDTIYLWPAVAADSATVWELVGHRRPTDWIASGPSAEPDCDARLHQPFAHYAVALAYAQQEDEQLEATYMKRYSADVLAARDAIMKPASDRPLIMGPHRYRRVGNRRGNRTVGVINTQGL